MKNYISTKKAAAEAQVTEPTIINWCVRYGIGRKVGGRWRVSPSLLSKMLAGDAEHDATRKSTAGTGI